MISGQAEVEVLGGNHTRAAMESLFSSGMMGGTVLVTLYENQTDEEALLIGVNHNLQDEESKFMTFMDKVLILKTIQTISKQWSLSKMKIFGFKSLAETRNKLSTMATVADLDQELFKKIVELARVYKGVTPIKQTAFTAFVTKSVEEQSKRFSSLEREGFEKFKKEMRMTGTQKKICPEEKDADHIRDDGETERDGGCSDADHAKQEEIESLKKEMVVLRKKLKDTEAENVQLKRKTDTSDGNQKKNSKGKGEFAVGKKVWALYTDEKSYPAKVIACNGESYTVMFIEDKIQHEVELDGLRPFGK